MEVHCSLDKLPELKKAILTIGAFDGVHMGHRKILQKVQEVKKSTGGESVVMTFHPHPRKVVFPNDHSMRLITTLDEKIHLIKDCGIDHMIIVPFTVEFSQINPYDYVEKIIIGKIKAKDVIIGYDHRFGLNREGNIDLLRHYEKQAKFRILEIPKQEVDDLKISSTKIRNYLTGGEISKANQLLGAPFRINGTIVHGDKIATDLGFPTANVKIEQPDKIMPMPGSYAATCLLSGKEYPGMCYIGRSETLKKEASISLEMNIFHSFDAPLYDKAIEIRFHKFIRRDQKFSNKKELITHIRQDQTEAQNYFKFHHRPEAENTTIAILNYNGRKLLEQFIPGIYAGLESRQELVVIDNASDDSSNAFLAENYPDIKVVSLANNQGYTGGYNQGLNAVKSRYTILLNSDIEITPGWIKPLFEFMEKSPEVAAVQPKVLSHHHRDKFEYAGACGGFLDSFGYPFCRGRVFDHCEKDQGQYDENKEIFWCTGAVMMIRTELFLKIRGFDTSYFAHQEEIDLCWRLKNCGYQFYCIPESVIYHVGGGTLNYNSPTKTYLNIRNNWRTILKNEKTGRLPVVVPIRIVLDLIFAIKLLISGQFSHGLNVFRALISIGTNLKSILSSRKETKIIKNLLSFGPATNGGRHPGLLPFEYFIQGRKKFSEIIK